MGRRTSTHQPGPIDTHTLSLSAAALRRLHRRPEAQIETADLGPHLHGRESIIKLKQRIHMVQRISSGGRALTSCMQSGQYPDHAAGFLGRNRTAIAACPRVGTTRACQHRACIASTRTSSMGWAMMADSCTRVAMAAVDVCVLEGRRIKSDERERESEAENKRRRQENRRHVQGLCWGYVYVCTDCGTHATRPKGTSR